MCKVLNKFCKLLQNNHNCAKYFNSAKHSDQGERADQAYWAPISDRLREGDREKKSVKSLVFYQTRRGGLN